LVAIWLVTSLLRALFGNILIKPGILLPTFSIWPPLLLAWNLCFFNRCWKVRTEPCPQLKH